MEFGTFLLLQSPANLTSEAMFARGTEMAEAADELKDWHEKLAALDMGNLPATSDGGTWSQFLTSAKEKLVQPTLYFVIQGIPDGVRHGKFSKLFI